MRGLDIDHTIRTAIGTFGDQGKINGAAVTILTVSFLVSVILEWKKQLRGERPDWSGPVTRLLVFGVLLGFYALVARSLVELVASLGDLQSIDPASAKKTVFAARAEAFSTSMGDDAGFAWSNLEIGAAAFVNSLLDVVTYLTFTIAAACVFILKVIQKVMLSVLLTLGPLMIAFGSIPGLTSQFLTAWILGVIEVVAWGITAKIFLAMLIASESATTINPNVTQNLAEHIVFNVVYGCSFLVIPVATAAILRGGTSGIGQSGVSAAKAAAIGGAAAMAGGVGAVSKKIDDLFKKDDDDRRSPNRRDDGASGGGGNERAGDGGVRAPAPGGDSPSSQRSEPSSQNGARISDQRDARRDAFARNAAIAKYAPKPNRS